MPKILLVEDEEALRDAFSVVLSALPYQSNIAQNGKTALELCQKTEYDLILLDLMMPVMDGISFLEEFLKTPNTAKVIVMSNLSSSTMLDAAFKLGIHGSVLKSDMSPGELMALIHAELAPTKHV